MSSSRIQAAVVSAWTAGLLLLTGGTVQAVGAVQRWGIAVLLAAACLTIHLSNMWLRDRVDQSVKGMEDDAYLTRTAEKGKSTTVTRLPRHG